MTATDVEIAVRLHAEDEVEFVEDLDEVAGGDVLRGCGDDNPYN